MVFMVLQKRQEQNMAGKSQTDLQIRHSRGFLGVRLAFLHDINISASIFVCLDHFHSFDESPLSRLYNHIQLSSNLMSGCDYSLFKVGLHLLSFLEPLRYSSAKNKYQTYPPGVTNIVCMEYKRRYLSEKWVSFGVNYPFIERLSGICIILHKTHYHDFKSFQLWLLQV